MYTLNFVGPLFKAIAAVIYIVLHIGTEDSVDQGRVSLRIRVIFWGPIWGQFCLKFPVSTPKSRLEQYIRWRLFRRQLIYCSQLDFGVLMGHFKQNCPHMGPLKITQILIETRPRLTMCLCLSKQAAVHGDQESRIK